MAIPHEPRESDPPAVDLSESERRSVLESLLRTRMFEEKVLEVYDDRGIPELPHLSIGQEAVGVGATTAIDESDIIVPSLRTRAPILMRVPLQTVVAGLFGTRSGPSNGRTTQHHMGSTAHGILGTTGLVGSHLNVAAGSGLSATILGDDRVTLAFLGDGATTRGEFHTALNFATVRTLPVIFLIENNGWTEATPIGAITPVDDLLDLVGDYLPKEVVNGQDVEQVYSSVSTAAERARRGDGPTLIEAKTYRYRPHAEVMADDRTEAEIAKWREMDPIDIYRDRLVDADVVDHQWIESTRESIATDLDAAFDFVATDPLPDIDVMHHVYTQSGIRSDGTVRR